MHREISHADSAFGERSNLPLYLFTGLVGLFIVLDLLAPTGRWLGVPALADMPREVWRFRFAVLGAILGGARVLYLSLLSLSEGRIGADLALAIACIAAIVIGEPLVAAEVVFIGLVGECLEGFTFQYTQNAIRKIAEVFPRRCWLLRDGVETRVLTSEVQPGDHVVVKPGAKVPVDGVVRAGRSAVDASPLTGESVPQDKGPGDEVLAGSVNQFGALTIEAVRVAQDTVAGRVIELTARALKDKASIERTADRLARYFLPAVLALALLTFLAGMFYHGTGLFKGPSSARPTFGGAITLSMYPTLAVLVVACPCALILATPAAVIAALGRLAGTGVLIKGGSALEKLAQVQAFAFDKTGTITEGKLELGEVLPMSGVAADELLRWAAEAEQQSEHPLGRVILDAARARQLMLEPLVDFEAQPGAGVRAQTAAAHLLIGSRRLLEENGVPLSAAALALVEQLDAAGQTPLLVARDGVFVGVLGARDRLRAEAGPMLAELRALGIRDIYLLTGDRRAATQALAGDLAFTAVHAELLPQQKAELVEDMKRGDDASGRRRVAMVGDGINDAPALAHADVGLALGGGADIAAEAGDIVFMGDPLKPLPLLVRLARQTVHIIRQNIIIFAFAVNAVGIVVTAWLWPLFAPAGWYEQSPLAAVIYHQLGSLCVLLNSMRLLWFERDSKTGWWARWEQRQKHIDEWLEQHLDIHELFHGLENHARKVALAAAGLVLLVWAGSGFTMVAPSEVAVVRRFGEPVADLEPGWHWRLPWPVENVTRVSQNVRVVEVGFREPTGPAQGPAQGPGALTWSSTHLKDSRIADESLMITGDGNLVDVLVVVRYLVVEPRVFLFQVRDADAMIRAAAESELRATVAGKPFLSLLTYKRAELEEEVLGRLRQRLANMTPSSLGIAVEGLSILDLHPPADVVRDYYEVAMAMENRDRVINEAKAGALKREKGAESESVQVLARARAAANEKIKQAQAETARFVEKSRARKELSFDEELPIYLEAVEAALSGMSPGDVAREFRARRAQRLRLQSGLVDFRIFWETISQALLGRDLMLIDSERVQGQRNFLLFDPDQLRVPMIVPQEPRRFPLAPQERAP